MDLQSLIAEECTAYDYKVMLKEKRPKSWPVFKSSPSQFITIIYSMDYGREGTKQELSKGTSRGQVTHQVRGQVTHQEKALGYQLSKEQMDIVNFCSIPRTAQEILDNKGLYNQSRARKRYILPLVDMGILTMTQPDSPKSPTQKYYLTDLGKALLENETK